MYATAGQEPHGPGPFVDFDYFTEFLYSSPRSDFGKFENMGRSNEKRGFSLREAYTELWKKDTTNFLWAREDILVTAQLSGHLWSALIAVRE